MTAPAALRDLESAERAHIIRALLRYPMLDSASAAKVGLEFGAVARHADELKRWFSYVAGWQLSVDTRQGFARLYKFTGFGDESRPATSSRGSRRPFTRRRYTLTCLLLAAVEVVGRVTTLRDLVEAVTAATSSFDDLETFDPSRIDERLAITDAVRLLVQLGVLDQRDSRGDYVDNPQTANALYHPHPRRLAAVLATPRPPAATGDIAEAFHEDRYGTWTGSSPSDALTAVPGWLRELSMFSVPMPADEGERLDTDEQRRLAARHRIMRRLLDSPSLLYDDLRESDREYLATITGWALARCAEAGMVVERRSEGWILIDPDAFATDIDFPAAERGGNVKHAALLTVDHLVAEARASGRSVFSRNEVSEFIAGLLHGHPKWAAAYQGDAGGALTGEVLDLLAGFDLLRASGGHLSLSPAAARYRAELRAAPASLWEDS